jgi:hypothetical protein
LVVRHSGTEAPVHGGHRLRDFYDWVMPSDIDSLLGKRLEGLVSLPCCIGIEGLHWDFVLAQ